MSLHFHEVINNRSDACGYILFVGGICNGIGVIAGVWNDILSKKYYRGENESVFQFLCRVHLGIHFGFDKYKDYVMAKKVGAILQGREFGFCTFAKFSLSHQQINIVKNQEDIVTKIEILSKSFIGQKTLKPAMAFTTAMESLVDYFGVRSIAFQHTFYIACACGIFPHKFMNYASVDDESSDGPGKLLRLFYNDKILSKVRKQKMKDDLPKDRIFRHFSSDVRKIVGNKVHLSVLENALSEVWYSLLENGILKDEKAFISKDEIPSNRKKVQCALKKRGNIPFLNKNLRTKTPDILIYDVHIGEWQHLFRVSEKGELKMRVSTKELNDFIKDFEKVTVRISETDGRIEIKNGKNKSLKNFFV